MYQPLVANGKLTNRTDNYDVDLEQQDKQKVVSHNYQHIFWLAVSCVRRTIVLAGGLFTAFLLLGLSIMLSDSGSVVANGLATFFMFLSFGVAIAAVVGATVDRWWYPVVATTIYFAALILVTAVLSAFVPP